MPIYRKSAVKRELLATGGILMAKQKVFLVDDDSDILVLNRDFLESEGYDVVTATTCAEALEKIKLHNFSCIVLDVMLPDGSAFDLAPKIKEFTDCPIIFQADF